MLDRITAIGRFDGVIESADEIARGGDNSSTKLGNQTSIGQCRFDRQPDREISDESKSRKNWLDSIDSRI